MNVNQLLLYLSHALKVEGDGSSIFSTDLTNGVSVEVDGILNIFCLLDSLGKIGAHYELILRFDNLNEDDHLENRLPTGASVNIFGYDKKLFSNFASLIDVLSKQDH
ncbi:hypothetical protein [Liquorilactobacillus mali]|uniref:hypothetical protein n=1 Tax=Liquorilactobacillus mali TaxID=1618 RepID=UPI0039EAEB3E